MGTTHVEKAVRSEFGNFQNTTMGTCFQRKNLSVETLYQMSKVSTIGLECSKESPGLCTFQEPTYRATTNYTKLLMVFTRYGKDLGGFIRVKIVYIYFLHRIDT